jgi:stage V sporulation protein R
MSAPWTVADLEEWDGRIREHVAVLGLDCFPQEFEVCDHNQMFGYMAYSGMPAHYPHWSYGKAYEKLKTLYDHGVSGLPYEMVINSNPSLAYLMRDNSLCLQILTVAHVYGHNDFFKNNLTFAGTRPEHTLSRFKSHADRVRSYVDTPGTGIDGVESILDAAHALSLQCRRNLAIRKLSPDEQRDRALDAARPRADPFARIHARPESTQPDLNRVPLEPDDDLLLFLRDHNPFLADWERDLLGIVHEQAQYFLPQIETKIMNEGWASFVHKRIMESLGLPQELHLEFLVRHSQVVRPTPGSLNPYHLGLRVWEEIERIATTPTDEERERLPAGITARELLLETRACDRDVSFLRRWLTPELMRELDLFRFEAKSGDLVVTDVANEAGWRTVRDALLMNVGMGGIPIIRVVDADWGGARTLLLRHEHDGRDLELRSAERTLAYVHRLWGRLVRVEPRLPGRPATLTHGDAGFEVSYGS